MGKEILRSSFKNESSFSMSSRSPEIIWSWSWNQIQAPSLLRQENSPKQLTAVDFCSFASFCSLRNILISFWVLIILNYILFFLGDFGWDLSLPGDFLGYLVCHVTRNRSLCSLLFTHINLSTLFPSNPTLNSTFSKDYLADTIHQII